MLGHTCFMHQVAHWPLDCKSGAVLVMHCKVHTLTYQPGSDKGQWATGDMLSRTELERTGMEWVLGGGGDCGTKKRILRYNGVGRI